MEKLFKRSKSIFLSQQSSVLSAATIIMIMIIASRVLGLVRQRTLAHFFDPQELALFFAGFRLPDLIFEVLVFGTFSSAFIPVFTKQLALSKEKAWETAANVVNIGLFAFVLLASFVMVVAHPLYKTFSPGFSQTERETIVTIARVLFAAQGFFIVSYVLTGVLESLRRFLIPALAPLFYNVGIIVGTIFLTPKFGIMGPVYGVVMGACAHFLIQLPLALKLGFRFIPRIKITPEVKYIGRLAAPRVLEVGILQVQKMVELFFASLISTASYTYFTLGNSLQLLPVGLFGTSIAKAALPTLAGQSENNKAFTKTFLAAFYQVIFMTLPIAALLIALRVPLIRLVFGTELFDWNATVQTGMVLSAFAFGVVFQSVNALTARAFYALHNTKTPVTVSIVAIVLIIIADFIFIRIFSSPVWGLAAGFSVGSAFQAFTLVFLLNRKVLKQPLSTLLKSPSKSAIAATASGGLMFFLLKIFDQSVWVKRLSFVNTFQISQDFPFQRFVLDTRYTINVFILTVVVSLIGVVTYILVSLLMKSDEVLSLLKLLKKVFIQRKVSPIPTQESEQVTPAPTETYGG